MSSGATTRTLPPAIRRGLARLRWARAAWVGVDALAAFAVCAVAFVAVSLPLDRLLRLDEPQRAVVLALAAGAVAVLAWRRLIRPLARGLPDEALARAVEARHRHLSESLLAAVAFARMADPAEAGYSPAMVRATIDLGRRRAAGVDFARALDRGRLRRNLLLILAAAAVLAAAGGLFPDTMRLWWQRNVLLADVAWPQQTHLAIVGATDGTLICPRGDDLAVEAGADPDGVVPRVVTLDHRQPGGTAGSETMVVVGDDRFRTVFPNVLEPFRLRVRGGDAITPWHEVRLVERPVVEDLTLRYAPPAYVGSEPRDLPKNVASYPVLVGGTVEVRGTASKPLARATMTVGDAAPVDLQRVGERGFRATLAGDDLRTGVHAVSLTDATGLASRRPARFSLRVMPDRAPTVRARLDGIGDLIVPRAVLPVRATLRDDYAVRKAELVCTTAVENGGEPETVRFPFGGPDQPYGGKRIEVAHRQECEPLGVPVGSRLTLRVDATDNDTVAGPKVGASRGFTLKVVSEDDLRADLLRREQEQRLEFERLLRDQRTLSENARALRAVLDDADRPFAEDDARLLATTEKRQRLVAGRCTAIADPFAQILAEVENNRLEADERVARDRLAGKIIAPLRRLARRDVLQAADLLDRAKRTDADAPGRKAHLDEAVAAQQAVLATMRKVLQNMVKWEGYQEAVSLLREVLRAQKNVSQETTEAQERRIRSIFDD
ncbi:MAG: hypothetical protein R6X20_06135 [Phycisphaerae bacterium]